MSVPTGNGTSQSPFQISNKSELLWFVEKVNKENATYGNAHAVLTADIVVNEGDIAGYDGVTSKNKVWDTWTPIGKPDYPFTGTFDGQCHTISGLFSRISYQTDVGLFGFIGNGGVVKNVGIENSWLSGYDNLGAACGTNEGEILNCYSTSTIVTYVDGAYIGGVCGNNAGTVSGCFNVGKMVLFNDEVEDKVHSDIDWYLTGKYSVLTGKTYTGVADARSAGTTTLSYYLSDTTTEDGGRTSKQFRLGEVAYWLSQSEGGSVWGQNVDYNSTEYYPVFGGDKVNASGINSECIAYANTPINETYSHNYVNAECTHCHHTLPMAQREDGTWEISNTDHLFEFARMIETDDTAEGVYRNANYVLTADIVVNEGDVSGCNGVKNPVWSDWEPIGRKYLHPTDPNDGSQGKEMYFGGTLDGQGHTISGIYCDFEGVLYNADYNYAYKNDCIGFFEYLNKTAVISNLGIVNSYFHGTLGSIKQYTTNYTNRRHSTYTGAITGDSHPLAVIVNCYTDCTVIGEHEYTGGIGGNTASYTANCFSAGKTINKRLRYSDNLVYGRAGLGLYKNCSVYYLHDYEIANYDQKHTVNVQTTTFSKTAVAFASGEVAYALAKDVTIKGVTYSGDIWGQNIGTDKYPNFSGAKVYKITSDCSEYSNTENGTTAHSFVNGICTHCGILQPNAEGVFEISTAEQLYRFAHMVNTQNDIYGNAKAKLTANIVINEGNVAGHDLTTKAHFKRFGCIGSTTAPFKGEFDGQNHTISGLYVQESSFSWNYNGLFGVIEGAKISNLGVVNSCVEPNYGNLDSASGGICGLSNGGTIENCYYKGNVGSSYFDENGNVVVGTK